MPFIPNTPESLLTGSDSNNLASTCRGLTSAGRPCRRVVRASPRSLKSIAIPDARRTQDAEMYCWQHKDQAATLSRASPQAHEAVAVTAARSSIDTLVDRLGLLELDGRDARGKDRQSEELRKQKERQVPLQGQVRRPRPDPSKRSGLALLCWLGAADSSKYAPRPVRIQDQLRSSVPIHPKQQSRRVETSHVRAKESPNRTSDSPSNFLATPSRLPICPDSSSKTAEFLSLIPQTTSPQTTAQLLSELDKPISPSDRKGYIYVFWLTQESHSSRPPSELVSSLFEPSASPTQARPGHRRTSEILQTFSSPSTIHKKILLKIGRASNVQRRLDQWSRQCGHNISLIRYYPYHTSSPSTRGPLTLQEVPYTHKVERLIHIELAENRAQESRKCFKCGREHREWFEVDASRKGISVIDEVIRRWVDWSLRSSI